MKIRITCVLAALCLGACATPTLNTPVGTKSDVAREVAQQRKFVVETMRDQSVTLYRVVYRLSTAATDLCADKVWGAAGIVSMSAKFFTGEYEAIARNELGYDDGLTVVAIMQDSPAESAGLQVGDHIVSIDGKLITNVRNDASTLQDNLKRGAQAQLPISMVVRRNGIERSVALTPIRACHYPASVKADDTVNAYADGQSMFVTQGMMNFIRSDEELALVLSHEMSHDILHHIDKKRENAVLGALAGVIADIAVAAATGANSGGAFTRTGSELGAKAYSVQFEQEADYEGLYIMRRAGYPIDNAANFWRRMGAENPQRITMRSTHPTTAERFVALNVAMQEISSKEAQGLALVPNSRPGQQTTQYASIPAPLSRQPTALVQQPRSTGTALAPASVPSPLTSAPSPPASKPPEKPSLGIIGGTVTRFDSGPAVNLINPYGAWVDGVMTESPAAKAGIKRADIIQTFNGHRVGSFEELNDYAAESAPGSTARLGLWRGKEFITVPVDFGK